MLTAAMKEFFVSDAAQFENQSVTSFFCIASVQVRDRKQGGQYLALSLADKTGQFEARMWEEFADVLDTCSEGCYVKAQGQVSKYQGKFQITITKMRAAAASEVDVADFVPTTQYDVAQMSAELRSYVDAFANADLRALVFAFLDDPAIGPLFAEAPAAKRLHHAWLGGLLEHVLTLVRLCRAVAPFYPLVDPDLLVTGAILHDIGKVRELAWKSSFSYTLEGQLIGHISIAQGMLHEKVTEMNARAVAAAEDGSEPRLFPDALRVLVEHMLLSHHGKLEFGSPKLPMTPEAILLSALDDLEAKFQTVNNEFASARATGRKVDDTTEWVRSMERALFDSQAWLAASREQEADAPAAPSLEAD
jgi:3'-5' exoribonuclease